MTWRVEGPQGRDRQVSPFRIAGRRPKTPPTLRNNQVTGKDESNSSLLHFPESPFDISLLEVNPPATVRHHPGLEPQAGSVQGRVLDTVIRCQAQQVDGLCAVSPEKALESRRAALGVVEKGAVTVDSRIRPLVKDLLNESGLQGGDQFRSGRALHAVDRPQDLLQPLHIDGLPNRTPRVVDGKTSVVARMPVLCGNDEFEDGGFQEAVGDRDDPISLRDGKSAAGTKVVLEVNQDEGAQICDYLPSLWRVARGRRCFFFTAGQVLLQLAQFPLKPS